MLDALVARDVENVAKAIIGDEAGARAFFTDMLGFDEFDSLSKDATIYPSDHLGIAAQLEIG